VVEVGLLGRLGEVGSFEEAFLVAGLFCGFLGGVSGWSGDDVVMRFVGKLTILDLAW
jgi:hypothetical protein